MYEYQSVNFISYVIAAAGIVGLWKLFTKAGEEGWAAIIPFYNMYVLFKITWGSGIKFLLLLIPIANIVILIMTMVKLAKAFGKGGGWACGLIFLYPLFVLIMGFSENIQYVGVPGQEWQSSPGGGYGGGYQNPYQQNPYQQPYQQPNQQPDYRQYSQPSAQNPDYHYQRNEPQSTGGNFCSTCGAKMEPGTKFCPTCGKQA